MGLSMQRLMLIWSLTRRTSIGGLLKIGNLNRTVPETPAGFCSQNAKLVSRERSKCTALDVTLGDFRDALS